MSTVRAFAVSAAAVMVLSSMLVKGRRERSAPFFSNRLFPPYQLGLVDSAERFVHPSWGRVTSSHNLLLD
jgi:hypothetical protein